MPPPYRKALIIGATSGIGLSLATRLVKEGSAVVVTGRRTSLLDEFVAAHPAQASSYALDVLSPSAVLADFVRAVTASHRDIDLVVFNAGIQRGLDFSSSVDLDVFQSELATNYTSVVTLFTQLLPHWLTPVTVVFVSATLGLVPTMVRTPGYNASKAALHSWLLNAREQLARNPATAHVRMVEVFPPAVQTELHDEKHQPDLIGGGGIGMPLETFTGLMWEGFEAGDEEVYVGKFPVAARDAVERPRRKMLEAGMGLVESALAPYMKLS